METSLPPTPPSAKTNVLAIISLIAGILGLLSVCLSIVPFLGWLCYGLAGLAGVVSLITGFIGRSQVKKNAEKGGGMAITGIVLGALTILGIFAMVIISMVAGSLVGNIFSQISSGLMPTPVP